jgi:cytochrome c556
LGDRAAGCDASHETKEATMSLRSITVLAALIVLQLCGCVTTSKPSDPSVNELERRHEEMMQRMGGGSGSGM